MKNCRESKNPRLKKVWKSTFVLTLFLTCLTCLAGVKNVYAGAADNPATVSQQQVRVTGKVTDQSMTPLPGVTVLVKGTSLGTVTDAGGAFSLSIPVNSEILQFSFIGMQSQEVSVKGKTAINVVMQQETVGLEEVVAVGYGTKKRADITGSISVVNSESFKSVKSFSAAQAIQGMAAGVNVTQSGVPGSAGKIFVRGVTSFGNTDPLVIVDGIQQSLNYINANEIESVQVLKDAGSAAIYGVRGANGVILVTTKKGKAGVPVLSYEASYGMQFPLRGNVWNVLNSEDYMNIYNIAYPSNTRFTKGLPDYMFRGPSGAGVAFEGDPEVDPSKYFYESPNKGKNYIIQKVNKDGTDWFHELFKSAPTM